MSRNDFLLPASLLLWLFSHPLSAAESLFDGLEVHGFATQGYVKTSDNRFFGDSESGSFDFREIGVNATFEPTDRLRLSGQLLSRRAGELYSDSPKVDFALADLAVRSGPRYKVNLMAGRIKNPIGLFNDTRDVAFTRPSIFLPQVIYFQKVRSLMLSADGLAVRSNLFLPSGSLELQVGVGTPVVDENVESAYLLNTYNGDFQPDSNSLVGRAMYISADESLRIALSGAKSTLVFEPHSGDLLTSGETDAVIWVASMQFTRGTLQFTTEYSQQPTKYRGYVSTPFEGQSPTMEAYYGQVGWQAASGVELALRFEEGFVDKADRSGSRFAAAAGLPAHSRFIKTKAIGARWDVSTSTMLMAEYQWNSGTSILNARENGRPGYSKRDWNLFALTLSYRF